MKQIKQTFCSLALWGGICAAAWADDSNFVIVDGVLVKYISPSEYSDPVNVTVPNGVRAIGDRAFYQSYDVGNVTLPAGVQSIGTEAFINCYNLTHVSIPSTLTSIGDRAFYSCGFTSLSRDAGGSWIGDGVQTIGDMAFFSCVHLTDVTIPANVQSIGASAFGGCPGLLRIDVDANNANYRVIESVLFSRTGDRLVQYPCGRTGFYWYPDSTPMGAGRAGTYEIPDGVAHINDYAFYGATYLTTVTIPASIRTIGTSAFSRCYNLITLTIPEGVQSIGAGAFYGCYMLNNVVMPNSLTSLGDAAFGFCRSLDTVYMRALTPPTLGGNEAFAQTPINRIFIPETSSFAYREAPYWRNLSVLRATIPVALDTIRIRIEVHDTARIPVTVHDTTHIYFYDTTHYAVDAYDTTWHHYDTLVIDTTLTPLIVWDTVTEWDTVEVTRWQHDTLWATRWDTVEVHDTTSVYIVLDIETGVETEVTDEARVSEVEGGVYLEGLTPRNPFAVYTLTGVLYVSDRTTSEGVYFLRNLPPGTYILEHDGRYSKFTHK